MKALYLAAPILVVLAAFAGCRSSGGPAETSEISETSETSAPVASPTMMLIEMTPPFRVISLTVSEWRKLGKDDAGHYRNPDTKQFTMALPLRCLNCDELIPPPMIPRTVAALPPSAERDAQIARIQQAYKCPKCGKSAYFTERTPGPAPSGQAPHN